MKIKLVFSALVVAFFSGCNQNTNDQKKETQSSGVSVPSFIIDAHVHYRATDDWEKSFLEVYKRHNAMACLMVRMEDLDRGINFAKTNPDRVIPYAMIDIDAPTVLEDVRKVQGMGYRGLGEFFARNEWNYDDPKYEPLW